MPRKKKTEETPISAEELLKDIEEESADSEVSEEEATEEFEEEIDESQEDEFEPTEVEPLGEEITDEFEEIDNSQEDELDSEIPAEKPKTKSVKKKAPTPSEKITSAIKSKAISGKGNRNILSAEVGFDAKTMTEQNSEILGDLQQSFYKRTPLRGQIISVEQTNTGKPYAYVNYEGISVIIPGTEMGISLENDENESSDKTSVRYSKLIQNMIGANIEFIVTGAIEDRNNTQAFAGSRKNALIRKQARMWYSKNPKITTGKEVEANILAVSQHALFCECAGIDVSVNKRKITESWEDLRELYFVGDTIVLRVDEIGSPKKTEKNEFVMPVIQVDIPQRFKKSFADKLLTMRKNSSHVGKVIGKSKNGQLLVLLANGVNARATIFRGEKPQIGDTISFVFSQAKGNEEKGRYAVGTITRIIRRKVYR